VPCLQKCLNLTEKKIKIKYLKIIEIKYFNCLNDVANGKFIVMKAPAIIVLPTIAVVEKRSGFDDIRFIKIVANVLFPTTFLRHKIRQFPQVFPYESGEFALAFCCTSHSGRHER
jgi:hypothetical protein